MNPSPMLPTPDTIPAPDWVFHSLELVFFTIHILLINILIGSAFIAVASRLRKPGTQPRLEAVFPTRLPTIFAIAVNMGVAVLLFVQVLYGHLFYTSSVLMATYWILIIPAVIIGYYALYAYARTSRTGIAATAIGLTGIILLGVAFAFVNNLMTMMHPDVWGAYFSNRSGTLLSLPDASFVPRYLHFVVASIAVGGLFAAAVWTIREKHGHPGSQDLVSRGLSVFGYATIGQIVIGFWFLMSLKQEYMLQFLGKNIAATIGLWLGFLCGVGAVASSLARQFRPTVIMIAVTIVAMVFVRDQLRSMYLEGIFDPATLEVNPQYSVLFLFVVVLLGGVAVVAWLVRAGFPASPGRSAQ